LSEPRNHNAIPTRPRLSRWTRLLFLCTACPDGAPAPTSRPYLNASTHHPGRFGPFLALRTPLNSGRRNPSPVSLIRRREWSVWNPFGTTGGTPTHARRTALKLEQLACARQALVRVPESNTKYGGKSGKPRGRAAPRLLPSISESSRIRKRKNLFFGSGVEPSPAVHRTTIYCPPGLALRRLRRCIGMSGQTCPSAMASGGDNRHGAADSRR
jgi:hypothetical protein